MKNIYSLFLAGLVGLLILVSSCGNDDEAPPIVNDPSLTVSSSSIAFGNVDAGTVSNVEQFTVTGADLTGNIAVSTQAPFAISTASDGTFGQDLNFTTDDFSAGPVTVFTRFEPGETDDGDFSADIMHTTDGATPVSVALSGTSVMQEPEPVSTVLVEDHFDYVESLLPSTDNTGAGADNAALDGWVRIRPANDGIFMHTSGLTFAGYPGSDAGKSVRLQKSAPDQADVYVNNLTEPQDDAFTGDFYVAYMLQIESFPSKSQFNRPVLLTQWADGGGAKWAEGPIILNRAAADATEDDVVFGLKYEGEPAVESTIVPEIGKTYLVVMKHTVTDTDLTNSNDASSVYIFDTDIPATEPATADVSIENMTDKYMIEGVTLLETNSNGGSYLVDGVKVAKTWEDLFN